MKLRTKIFLLAVAGIAALGILVTLSAVRTIRNEMRSEFEQKGINLARYLAYRLISPLLEGNRRVLARELADLRAGEPEVRFLYLVGFDGEVLAHTFPSGFPVDLLEGEMLSPDSSGGVRLLSLNGEPITEVGYRVVEGGRAEVRIGFAEGSLNMAVGQLRERVVLASLITILVALVLFAAILDLFSIRLDRLTESASEFGSTGKWRAVPEGPSDEIGILTVAFNRMARELTASLRRSEESEERFRLLSRQFEGLLDAIPDNITFQNPELRILWANRGAGRALGKETSDLVGKHCYDLWHCRKTPCDDCPVLRSVESRLPETGVVTTPDRRTWELRAVPILEGDGGLLGVVEVGRDISEIKRLEERLYQTHRLDSLGRLAGGVAHDFNNLLTVITGYANLLLGRLGTKGEHRREVEEISRAADRASALTRQLLAYGRRQILKSEVLDLNEVVRGMREILQALAGERIRIVTSLEPALARVKGDAGQLEQVVTNLVLNARDAMPEGGSILLETGNAEVTPAFAKEHTPMPPGPYVLLAVRDSGVGMTEEVRKRIFDPFFSTKEVGKGSGLGLSTVYGIVKQSGGFVWAESEPGKGTSFEIYLPPLPRAEGAGQAAR